MKRREFLWLSALSSLFTQRAMASKSAYNTANNTVIVVGAGISGLAAARMLHQAGYQVTVLEGRDRIGGRVWTSRQWSDVPVDLGASWIHGTRRNPLSKLADQVGSKRVLTDYDNSKLYQTNGAPADTAIWQALDQLSDALLSLLKEDARSDETIAALLQRTPEWHHLSTAQRQLATHILNTGIEHEFSGSLAELSAANFDDADAYSGPDVLFPNGYGELTDYLSQDLDIQLQQRVQTIHYNRLGVSVTTSQGAFKADKVIITLPIGVLKRQNVQFVPALPNTTQQAISQIGSGLLNKLFLRFPYVFWDKQPEIINWVSAEHGRWNEWLNVAAYTGQPVLLGFNAADYARKTERWSDQAIVDDAMQVLRTLYGQNIPLPDSWQISRWASDPFAYGSYSFNQVGAGRWSRNALAEPIDGVLFFAGEATSEDHPSTVHGAYSSGLRAAKQLTAS